MPAFAGSSVFSGSAFAGGTVFEAAVVAPSAPASVTLTANTGTTATFLVVPGAVAGDSYTLQLETPSGAGNWSTPAGTWAGTTFIVTGLTPATSYRARASATNGLGTSAYTVGDAFATDNIGSGSVDGGAPAPAPAESYSLVVPRMALSASGETFRLVLSDNTPVAAIRRNGAYLPITVRPGSRGIAITSAGELLQLI